ncbi:MAG: DUF6758 family protein [Actinomycetes bacterium]
MRADPSCPRCGGGLHSPGLWSSEWQCDKHGAVPPMQPVVQPTAEVLRQVTAGSAVPVWLPWPLPKGWLVTGVGHAGDERTGARATVVACSGPAPLGGVAELLLAAEEPGVGLGARLAGIEGLDPGSEAAGSRAPDAKIHANGHPTAMWTLPGAGDRAVYVGEAMAVWLWAVLWPESAGFLLIDDFVLTDVRDAGLDLDVPFGALSPRLLV